MTLLTTFKIGVAVEETPAKGMHTLYIDGLPTPAEVADRLKDLPASITHIHLGFNHSFNPEKNYEVWEKWEGVARQCLEQELWVTLEMDVKYVPDLHESCMTEATRFIPLIVLELPYISLLNYNATVKIGQGTFNASNPGVWCVGVNELTNRKNFTQWDSYIFKEGE